jgi:hypothetical protein
MGCSHARVGFLSPRGPQIHTDLVLQPWASLTGFYKDTSTCIVLGTRACVVSVLTIRIEAVVVVLDRTINARWIWRISHAAHHTTGGWCSWVCVVAAGIYTMVIVNNPPVIDGAVVFVHLAVSCVDVACVVKEYHWDDKTWLNLDA